METGLGWVAGETWAVPWERLCPRACLQHGEVRLGIAVNLLLRHVDEVAGGRVHDMVCRGEAHGIW